MASKKGLSEAEKRTRMSEIFLSGDFYTFKEIEKIATQQKKIVLQSIKEVLQSLVDDRLVMSDKIGTSIYYWSFPSDAQRTRMTKIEELKKEVEDLQQRKAEVTRLIEEASSVRQDNDERAALLECLQNKEEIKRTKEEELAKFKDSDPRVFEERVRLVNLYKEAANRVTDNIWILHGYFTRNLGANREDVNRHFDINEDELEDII